MLLHCSIYDCLLNILLIEDGEKRGASSKELIYRIGGDEFIILLNKTDEEVLKVLVERIKKNVSKTKYSCSIGYCYRPEDKDFEAMVKESDAMMYEDKARYYQKLGIDRRSK